jgi:exopolysaccharide biosynthesis polyprenyl glycosylphosphotransferase
MGRARVSDRRRLDDAMHLKLDAPTHARLGLQRRAPGNLRRHVQRTAIRFATLILADMAVFGLMRELIRAVRDRGLLGEWVARDLQAALPLGYMNGWQFPAALFLGLLVFGTYGTHDRRPDPGRLFLACALAAALPLWTMLWERGVGVVLLQYAITVSLVWIGVLAERMTIDRIVARVRDPERDAAETLFVGSADECRAVASSPAFGRGTEYRPIGFIDTQAPAAAGALGSFAELPTLLAASGAEVVVICGVPSDTQLGAVVDAALMSGCQVLSTPRGFAAAGVQPKTVWRHGQPFVELTTPSLKGQRLLVKRALDLAGVLVGLVVALPVMVLVAAIIKLDSPGSAIFSQERIGTGGRRFRVFKFRTMHNGSSDAAHRELIRRLETEAVTPAAPRDGNGATVYKLVDDARVTRVGRWLRRTSLDELPQLFNVLRGEMSLVGPRPPLPYEFEHYAHWQLDRLQVKPGITGLWQVSGRSLLSYRQMHELDIQYVQSWSLGLDLSIMLRTIPVVLFNSGRAH